jgi:hypothetical protein
MTRLDGKTAVITGIRVNVPGPAELGTAATFLASSDSSFMSACEVAVDGGLAQL